MASTKGRQASYNRKVHVQEEITLHVRRAERQRSPRPVPETLKIGYFAEQRRCFLISILLHETVRKSKSFGIVWSSLCEWAPGPSIVPYAHIFDRYVRGVWNVTVVDNIDGNGSPGWLFERA